MQCAATAGTGRRADVDADFFARQIVGKRLAPRLSLLRVLRLGGRLRLGFSARLVSLKVFQSERKLVGIDALRPAAKPRALKLLDDQLEPFDLTVALPWFSITLSISGDDVDPKAISDLLRVQPDKAWKKDERLPAKAGRLERLRSSGRWSIRLRREDTDEWDVEAAICSVLDRVGVQGDVWRSAVGGGQARLFVGLSLDSRNCGFGFSPQFLRRIADLKIQLDFDLYADELLGGVPG
jgi:hypothetical protein